MAKRMILKFSEMDWRRMQGDTSSVLVSMDDGDNLIAIFPTPQTCSVVVGREVAEGIGGSPFTGLVVDLVDGLGAILDL